MLVCDNAARSADVRQELECGPIRAIADCRRGCCCDCHLSLSDVSPHRQEALAKNPCGILLHPPAAHVSVFSGDTGEFGRVWILSATGAYNALELACDVAIERYGCFRFKDIGQWLCRGDTLQLDGLRFARSG